MKQLFILLVIMSLGVASIAQQDTSKSTVVNVGTRPVSDTAKAALTGAVGNIDAVNPSVNIDTPRSTTIKSNLRKGTASGSKDSNSKGGEAPSDKNIDYNKIVEYLNKKIEDSKKKGLTQSDKKEIKNIIKEKRKAFIDSLAHPDQSKDVTHKMLDPEKTFAVYYDYRYDMGSKDPDKGAWYKCYPVSRYPAHEKYVEVRREKLKGSVMYFNHNAKVTFININAAKYTLKVGDQYVDYSYNLKSDPSPALDTARKEPQDASSKKLDEISVKLDSTNSIFKNAKLQTQYFLNSKGDKAQFKNNLNTQVSTKDVLTDLRNNRDHVVISDSDRYEIARIIDTVSAQSIFLSQSLVDSATVEITIPLFKDTINGKSIVDISNVRRLLKTEYDSTKKLIDSTKIHIRRIIKINAREYIGQLSLYINRMDSAKNLDSEFFAERELISSQVKKYLQSTLNCVVVDSCCALDTTDICDPVPIRKAFRKLLEKSIYDAYKFASKSDSIKVDDILKSDSNIVNLYNSITSLSYRTSILNKIPTELSSPSVPVDERDELFKVIHLIDNTKKPRESLIIDGLTSPRVYIRGAIKVNVSVGMGMNGLADNTYKTFDTVPRYVPNPNQLDTAHKVLSIPQRYILRTDRNFGEFMVNTLVHFYYTTGSAFNVGYTLGLGVTNSGRADFLTGFSLVFGRNERLVFTGGLAVSKVDRLKNTLVNELRGGNMNSSNPSGFYDAKNYAIDDVIVSRWTPSWFFTLSWNLVPKNNVLNKTVGSKQ